MLSLRISALIPLLAIALACTAVPPAAGDDSTTREPTVQAVTDSKHTDNASVAPATLVKPKRSEFWFSSSARQGALLKARAPSGVSALKLDDQSVEMADDGFFIIGFNRDAPVQQTLTWTSADGQAGERVFDVAQRSWKIQHVNVSLPRGRKATERRNRELAAIKAARAENHPTAGWRQDFIWPIEYWNIRRGRISGVFGSQRFYRGSPGGYHTGLDIAAPTGTPYVAPADGVVTLATEQPFSREGYLLMIDHGMGLNSAFVHSSKLLVKKGDIVKQGQAIGLVGATGIGTGPHLHWSLMWKAARLDPLPLLPKRP